MEAQTTEVFNSLITYSEHPHGVEAEIKKVYQTENDYHYDVSIKNKSVFQIIQKGNTFECLLNGRSSEIQKVGEQIFWSTAPADGLYLDSSYSDYL